MNNEWSDTGTDVYKNRDLHFKWTDLHVALEASLNRSVHRGDAQQGR